MTSNFRTVLETLSVHQVDFILVGGMAAVLQGAPLNTYDLDIVYSRAPENLPRLLAALEELDAYYREPGNRRLRPRLSHLESPGHKLLHTCHGPLDVLGTIANDRDFDDLLPHSNLLWVSTTLQVRVLDLPTLILVKEAAGRDKDKAALPILRQTLEQKRKQEKQRPALFVSHLESALDGTRFPVGQVHTTHQGRPLWVRYDLEAIARRFPRDRARETTSLWRYRELLPLPFEVEPVSLGEGMTPLLPCPRLGQALGVPDLWIKDESQLPTGSFKSRGMTVAVSMAKHLGLKRLAIPTAGNAGGALAVYGARAGMEVFVFMPDDTPRINQMEALLAGAKVFLVNGLITDCGRIVREGAAQAGWFDMSTLKEPYRLEGKKTMGLELAEHLDWTLPDVILYPTGGGTGLIGMWKAFRELQELGWLAPSPPAPLPRRGEGSNPPSPPAPLPRRGEGGILFPRMIACQSDGCAPIVRAFETGKRFAEPFPNAHTIASGLRVPAAVGDFMMLDVIRESGGLAIAGREPRILEWMRRVTAAEGIAICPETAVCFDCLEQLRNQGVIGERERVVVFNTGAAQKYPEVMPLDAAPLTRIDKDRPTEYQKLIGT